MSNTNYQQLSCFLEKWKKLHVAVNEITPDARILAQIEDVLEENEKAQMEISKLHIKLQKSKKEEERLGCFNQEMIEEFEKRILAVREEQNSSIMKATTMLEEAKEEVAGSRSKSEESEQRCISLERELESQRCQLSAQSDEHQRLISEFGFVELDKDFSDRLDQLAIELHKLAESALLDGFSKLGEENQDKLFRQLVNSKFVDYERPIPISNSTASRHLRVATLQTIIVTELMSSVFIAMPSYTFWLNPVSPTPNWNRMAKENSLQEAVMRSVSSIVYAADEQELEETRIASISDRISSKLRPLLIEMTSFEKKLQRLLRESFDIWREVQRSPQRIVALTDGNANMEYPAFDIDEGISIPGSSIQGFSMQGAVRADKLGSPIVTFPTISAVASSKLLHAGYAMRASNPLYISGAIEAGHQVKRVRERG
ncbi:hypothetical protein N7456_006923 [Penicillium angulare]|uniref:Uncharacterized protein n=1 Tax=Penicillium angulare TaxID=116970 RepID=A0A9W9FIL4_9EURO|nr:hypothetical protein N7456_006923 [Penicillium angulare]